MSETFAQREEFYAGFTPEQLNLSDPFGKRLNAQEGKDLYTVTKNILRVKYNMEATPECLYNLVEDYLASPEDIEDVIAKRFRLEPESIQILPARKPFTVRVNVDIYYDIDPNTLPNWVDELGVEKLVECAFDDHNREFTLEALSASGVLGQAPVEVTRNSVSIA